MLNENIRVMRKAKGFSQEELAVRLSVVRQTVSKWEQGLSVPDADLLLRLSEVLGTPVGTLLGETVDPPAAEELQKISEKLETINWQLARQKETKRRTLHILMLSLAALTAILFLILAALGSPYLSWDLSDPETAVLGTAYHVFEYLFVRTAPFLLCAFVAGAILTRKRNA